MTNTNSQQTESNDSRAKACARKGVYTMHNIMSLQALRRRLPERIVVGQSA